MDILRKNTSTLKKYLYKNKIISKKNIKNIKNINRRHILEGIVMDHFNSHAITIQKNIKMFLAKKYKSDLKAQNKLIKQSTYYNEETLLGDNIEDIEQNYFYSLDNYAFDIRELKKINKNPYTNIPYSDEIRKQIDRILRRLEKEGISTDLEIEIPYASQLSTNIAELFLKLQYNNTYPAVDILLDFSNRKLFYYMKFIYNTIIIRKYFNDNEMNNIRYLYNRTEEEDEDNNEFRCYCFFIINNLSKINTDEIDIVSIILSESMRNDIDHAYHNEEYDNYNI